MPINPPIPPDVEELQNQVDSLQHLVVSILILMVVVSGTLSVFLLRQWRMSSKDLAATRPGASQFINDYNKERAPRIDAFLEKLREFGKTNPSFAPIMVRYGLSFNALPARPTLNPPTVPKK